MPGRFLKIATAEVLRFTDRTPVRSPADYLGWHRERLAEAGDVARAWSCALPVSARVNHGRWIVPCVNCRTATALTHPAWRLACCGDCGCVLTNVLFTNDWSAIEGVLLERPDRATQNWLPAETLADLARENDAHGVAA